MNITRLTIDQVAKLWDSIRYGIVTAFYPVIDIDAKTLQEILRRLLKEEMQCWCIYNDDKQVYGHVITVLETSISNKVLLIYSEHLFNSLPEKEDYFNISDKLERFAKENGCTRMIAYSSKPNAISLAEKLGYSSEQRVLIKEV